VCDIAPVLGESIDHVHTAAVGDADVLQEQREFLVGYTAECDGLRLQALRFRHDQYPVLIDITFDLAGLVDQGGVVPFVVEVGLVAVGVPFYP
jgi:hypothetical protein